MLMPTRPPLADLLPYAADFVIEVLAAAARAPFGQLSWVEINRLSARWLRPEAAATGADSSRLGHAIMIEMSAHGLLEIEMTTAADGQLMVRQVAHPRFAGIQAARALAA